MKTAKELYEIAALAKEKIDAKKAEEQLSQILPLLEKAAQNGVFSVVIETIELGLIAENKLISLGYKISPMGDGFMVSWS